MLRSLVLYILCLLGVTFVLFPFCVELAIADDALSLADQLLRSGDYYSAVTEYKRFIFFNKDHMAVAEDEHVSYAFYNMGLAYRAYGDWQSAIDALSESILTTAIPDVADERRITLAGTLIASGNYSLARLELARVLEFSRSPSLRLKAIYFSGIASLYMFDWDSAKKAFNNFYSMHADEKAEDRAKKVESILTQAEAGYRSVKLAKVLSAILPGAGQVYAGDWRDGLNAFILNGSLFGLVIHSLYKKDYKSALLIFSLLTSRYYLGNIYRAGMDVRRYNESIDRKNATRVLELVSADEPREQ